MSASSMIVFIGGIIGAKLSPTDSLSTLPVASVVVGTALAIIPVTSLMKHLGRFKSFQFIFILSILNTLFTSYALYLTNFYLFCLSTLMYGVTIACVMQFRFAAMESVSINLHAKAASVVLLGGIAAAFIGPEAAIAGRDLFSIEFIGSFLLLGSLFFIGLILLLWFQNTTFESIHNHKNQRPLMTIAKQYNFWVAILSATLGYAIMSFIMTATPVSMHHINGHSLDSTKWVIQSHIVAMFLPSLLAAWIIEKLGLFKMMIAGVICFVICILIAFIDQEVINYWISLVFLGIGWNFLFIGGTTLLPGTYRDSERFKVQAFNDFIIFSCQAISSLSAGWFVFAIGWKAMILLCLPLLIIHSIVLIRFKLKPR